MADGIFLLDGSQMAPENLFMLCEVVEKASDIFSGSTFFGQTFPTGCHLTVATENIFTSSCQIKCFRTKLFWTGFPIGAENPLPQLPLIYFCPNYRFSLHKAELFDSSNFSSFFKYCKKYCQIKAHRTRGLSS